MKNLLLILFLGVVLNLIFVRDIHADSSAPEVVPYQISIISPLQTSGVMTSVKGIRCNIVYGSNQDVSGLDFGLFNNVDGNQTGLQFGLFNSSFKSSGVQIGIVNKTEYLKGLQIGFLNIHNEGDLRFLPGINFAF